MAFEAINFDGLETVTSDAKAVFTRDYAVIFGAGMTLDAVFQAVFTRTDTLTHGLITLMPQ
jgi:hypothetical protein